jgi:hypothetical protein
VLSDRYSGKWSQLRVDDRIDTRTAGGALVLKILASVSQWERGVMSRPTKDAPAYRKANRERTVRVPYGWQLDCDGVHVDANARDQGLSLRQIGHELTQRGMYPRRGCAWHPESVSKLLKAGRIGLLRRGRRGPEGDSKRLTGSGRANDLTLSPATPTTLATSLSIWP